MKIFRKNKTKMNKTPVWFIDSITVSLKSIMLYIFFLFVYPTMIYAQDSILKVTPDFERIDTLQFLALMGESGKKEEIQADGTAVFHYKREEGYSYIIYPPDSYLGLFKRFYPNGNIEEKGVVFTYGRLMIGIWYYFDEEGKLTETIDHDTPYSFTLEDMLEYARQQGVFLPTSPEVWELKPPYASLNRTPFFGESGYYDWDLSWITDDGLYRKTIRLDHYGFFILKRCELIRDKKNDSIDN